jgi:ABC-type transporter Mla MlaB component
MTIAEAAELHARVCAAAAADAVQIDGSQVDEIDTAALQMLVVLVNGHRAQGRTVQWAPPPAPKLVENARLIGVTAYLGLADPKAA